MKTIEEIIEKVKELDWSIEKEDENSYRLGKYSPAGQDFSIVVHNKGNIDEFLDEIYARYNEFDVSEEAYLWLDESGHGTNGAPYDMKDVYEDMKWCKNSINELYDDLKYWTKNYDKPLKIFEFTAYDLVNDGNSYTQYIASRDESRAEDLFVEEAYNHYVSFDYAFSEVDEEYYEELYEYYNFKEDVIYDKN